MSTPRYKKDKEIIADYESQVKGKDIHCMHREMLVIVCGAVLQIWKPVARFD